MVKYVSSILFEVVKSVNAVSSLLSYASFPGRVGFEVLNILRMQIFIDELDAIAPARRDGGDDLSQRMVATLLGLMDGISRTDGILIIAATNRPDSIEPALRRPGRLDREIEIGT